MSRFLDSRGDVDYTGVDIVPDLIESHRSLFADRPWTFIVSDIVDDGLNATLRIYDLVLSRQTLLHLEFADVFSILRHISSLGRVSDRPAYLLTTTFSTVSVNHNIQLQSHGRFQPLNLELSPISLLPPLCIVRDGNWYHYIGMWKLPLQQLTRCKVEEYSVVGFPNPLFRC